MRTSPEKRNPSGSKELSGAKKFGALVTAAAVSVEALFVGACGAKDNAIENSGSETTQSATPSPTWTPNIPKKTSTPTPSETKAESTESTSYETPDVENAVPASELLDKALFSKTVKEINDEVTALVTDENAKESITSEALCILALMVDAAKTREHYLHHMQEYKGANPLKSPLKEMNKWQLAQALDYPLLIASTAAEDGFADMGGEALDKDQAGKIVARVGGWSRVPAIYDNITAQSTITLAIDPEDKNRTAEIVDSRFIEIEGMGQVEVITVYRTSSPGAIDLPPGVTEWKEDFLLVPATALDTLPVVYGTSKYAEGHAADYNRPRFDKELGTYVTSDGNPVLIPLRASFSTVDL